MFIWGKKYGSLLQSALTIQSKQILHTTYYISTIFMLFFTYIFNIILFLILKCNIKIVVLNISCKNIVLK